MTILVYLRDGRTVYRIPSRGKLHSLVKGNAWDDEEKSLPVQRGIWNPSTGTYVWTGVLVRHIAKNEIGYVEEELRDGQQAP